MRIQFKPGTFAVGVLSMICALAVATTAAAKNPKEVRLEIDNDTLVIKTKPHENDCPWDEPREDGCIKVKKRKKSDIYFHLTGNTKCGLESGTSWTLNAVYLGGFDADVKPGEFGFASISDTDFDKVNTDFDIADRNSGRVTLTGQTETRLAMHDDNQSEYLVWYKIEAICPRSDGGKSHITAADPRIKNGGTL